MIEYYIAPSYRKYKIIKDNILEDGKQYGIIDFNGYNKKIRLWDKPQSSWKDYKTCSPIISNTILPHLENIGGYECAIGLTDTTLAQEVGFDKYGYVWVLAPRDSYSRECAYEYWTKHSDIVLTHKKIGAYIISEEKPTIGIPVFKLEQTDIMLDNNTWLPREDILHTLYILRTK